MARIVIISLYDVEAIGVRYIHSVLTSHGHQCDLIFYKERAPYMLAMDEEPGLKLLPDLVKSLEPDLVGVSLRSSFRKVAAKATELIREKVNVPIIWGGTDPTIDPDSSFKYVDAIIRGEGEFPLLDIANRIDAKQPWHDVENLWVKNNRELVKNDMRQLLPNLDEIPFPDYDQADKHWIDTGVESGRDPWMKDGLLPEYTIMASRGCPYDCAYCINSGIMEIFKGKGTIVRKRSVKNVIDELEIAKEKFGAKTVFYMDEVFGFDRDWAEEFCAEYKAKIALPFKIEIYPTILDEKLINLMADAGLWILSIGVQSGSDRIMRDVFRRHPAKEEVIRASKAAAKKKILTLYDFILDNPFDTPEDLRDTLEFALKLERPVNLSLLSLAFFPGTKVTEQALAQGLISPEDVEGESSKAAQQWKIRPGKVINNKHLYFNYLMILANVKLSMEPLSQTRHIVPKRLLKWLGRNEFLSKRPKLMLRLVTPPLWVIQRAYALYKFLRR